MRRSNYGLEPDQYDDMVIAQDGKCGICKYAFKGARDTHIDHDHETGAVRALLCGNCNLGLGNFKDDVIRLQSAIDYVEKHRVKAVAA